MKAIIATTYDDQYLFFLPITTWCWNKLGVGVICFEPSVENWANGFERLDLISRVSFDNKLTVEHRTFKAPEHKQATYAQCSRLFAGCLDLPDDEILITSDIDMMVFRVPPIPQKTHDFTVFGSDLTPQGQYPICYVAGEKQTWEAYFRCHKTLQGCLDELLGDIECENFRGNYWSKDQEHLFNTLLPAKVEHIDRARPGTQFASNRIDRDDAFFMDRLSPDIIDYHMHRPGYTDENFEKILSVIHHFYPHEDLTWMRNYQQAYKQLL